MNLGKRGVLCEQKPKKIFRCEELYRSAVKNKRFIYGYKVHRQVAESLVCCVKFHRFAIYVGYYCCFTTTPPRLIAAVRILFASGVLVSPRKAALTVGRLVLNIAAMR